MNRSGYTLLEVTLFMAISSTLALVAFVGLGPRLRNVRFTDSVRGVEAFIQESVSDAQAGENGVQGLKCSLDTDDKVKVSTLSPAEAQKNTGSSQDCVFNGFQLLFSKNTVQAYQLVSRREKNPNPDFCPQNLENLALQTAACYGTTAVGFDSTEEELKQTVKTYSLNYGLEMTDIVPDIGSANPQTSFFIGYVVNPDDNKLHLFLQDQENPGGDTRKLCYNLGGRRASVNFSVQTIQPKIIFDDGDCA